MNTRDHMLMCVCRFVCENDSTCVVYIFSIATYVSLDQRLHLFEPLFLHKIVVRFK